MGYQHCEIDALALEHFARINHHAHKHHGHGGRWENPQLVSVWREKVGHHDHLYWIHVKTGHMGNHHNFTLVYEIRHGHETLLDIH